jgi:hypothetical protein
MAAATTPKQLLVTKHLNILPQLVRVVDLLVYGRKTYQLIGSLLA